MTTETNEDFMRRMEEILEKTRIFLALQVDSNDFVRLFNQAERANGIENRSVLNSLKECNDENARLRESLEFYAEQTKYMYKSMSLNGHPKIIKDEGETARKALAGVTNGQR